MFDSATASPSTSAAAAAARATSAHPASVSAGLTRPGLEATDTFAERHLGPNDVEIAQMLDFLGFGSLEELVDMTVPAGIRMKRPLELPAPLGESGALAKLRGVMGKNKVMRSFIGMGYHDTLTPPVIQRNILENPGWYTAYTPYQAEIAQGRLEALLNFQTMIIDLTGLEIANASLLDEGTAAAEAMALAWHGRTNLEARRFFISDTVHPQTLDVVRTRALPLGIEIVTGDHRDVKLDGLCGVLVQYPASEGEIFDYEGFFTRAHAAGATTIVAADPLSLVLLRPPGQFGADIAVGSTQRFGVPLGFGGPHAGYLATKDAFKRQMPGRLIGVSHDAQGKPALRLSLQTREQHIRREKATSNICTAQVLLAVIASMYAVYHGPRGLRRIAERVHLYAETFRAGLARLGFTVDEDPIFDTVRVLLTEDGSAASVQARAEAAGINLRVVDSKTIGVSFNETVTERDLLDLLSLFDTNRAQKLDLPAIAAAQSAGVYPAPFAREGEILTHPIFRRYHTETEMLRYLRRLESRDLSLTTSMIPLGSCTMKLNATSEMFPVTWPEVGRMHPFAPAAQTEGYREMVTQLETWLAEITGMAGVSLQPNAGSQGEFAGLVAIRAYHESRGQGARNICLIPASAHGTNPASAVMAGFKVVPVACDKSGNVDLADLTAKIDAHQADLACLMVTYPSTHGVFEESITEIARLVHAAGGQVYMDGANLTAQVGLCRPGDFGMDVCHLNLHKTFCIPHGGGGPGVGPVVVMEHLVPFLPGHAVVNPGTAGKVGAISAAPWGSASILVISWMYIAMLGAEGLKKATQVAILNANYIARQLEPYFPVLYKGHGDLVAHECIVDFRPAKKLAGVEVEDVAKRLIDYGFHAPTMSWPVAGTMMIEPTESESKAELDRFCDSLIAIHGEIQAIAAGEADKANNALKNAPHTAQVVTADAWDRPYSRDLAAYPLPYTRQHKFWPVVGRIDNVYGDRNLVCSCPPMEDFAD